MDSGVTVNDEPAMVPVPKMCIMMALRGVVVMPGMQIPLDVARQKSLTALNRALEKNQNIFLATQKHHSVDNPGPKDIARVGCVCQIKQVVQMSNELMRIVVVGLERAKIMSYTAINPCFEVEIEDYPDKPSDELTITALGKMLKDAYEDFVLTENKIPGEILDKLSLNRPKELCYTLAQYLFDSDQDKIDFLSINSEEIRMERTIVAINKMLELVRVEKKISGKIRKSMDNSQKEYYLRERVKAIHDELGDDLDDLDDLRDRAKNLPQEACEKAEKEISRMRRMNPTSPEAGVSRSYVDWLLDVPWTARTTDNEDLNKAREILDADHYGMQKVKERILEYIAVMTLSRKIKGPILCFVGPPGVGKTSIAKSIARALDRKFATMSLGGVKDEAEIRGHRRTYIGAIPGGIIYNIKKAGVINPVFLLDEIDKMSSDYRGDPASAMLEVLDPEQNNHFTDHYLEVAYDLSQVLFVTTANTLETIPAPLLDRMEVIELSGYTEEEKVRIAELYLVKKQTESCGLQSGRIEFTEAGIRSIINGYTRESGVRNLERNIGAVCRKIARKIVEGDQNEKFMIDAGDVEELLGVSKYTFEELDERDRVGEATGLAWTSVGGTTLPIEVALIEGGKGEVILTGKLGDVMKESARTAISVVRTHAKEYGIDPKLFETTDIHIHVPEGATPKDGPSAGITIATAVLSAFSGRSVDHLVAMTGEITLLGKVLPIGGLKEKLLAAARLGIKTVIIPSKNKKDLPEIPENIKSNLNIRVVDEVSQVFPIALKQPGAVSTSAPV